MRATHTATPEASAPQIEDILGPWHDEALRLALPTLMVLGSLLMASSAQIPDPLRAIYPGLLLYLLPVAVWALRRWHRLVAAWVLVVGSVSAVLTLVVWSHVGAAIHLLALPIGLAALSISMAGGAATATGCTLLLLCAPDTIVPGDNALRIVAAIGAWGTLGMIWLSTRPLLTAVQWSWSSHQESRRLLERARDYQVQLKQVLQDLADANLQLTRLNRLTEGLRQSAEEARAAKEQFVANVSHELRTPLNMIVGFTEMVVRAPQTYGSIPAALLADLTVILRNSQHLSSLIDDVLDLSRIEAGKMALTRERVALREIMEAGAIAVRPLFESKGLSLEVELAEDVPDVLCDRTRVREVVLNLLSNAGRFTECGGVRLRAWKQANDAVVSVTDSGPGIPIADVDRIFQPFQQLDGSLRRRYGGSGLGLAISKSFVELHGGKMWLESQVGEGTTFYFRLPIDPPARLETGISRWFNPYWQYEERTRRSLAPVAVMRARFVVLESSDSLQRLLSRYEDGAEVVAVSSIEEAIEELSRVPAQALLVNDLSVGEARQRLKLLGTVPGATPVITCSIPGTDSAAGALGVSEYLVKPIAREALLKALDRLNLPGKTILVVDDEPEAVRLLQRMLASSRRGYRVLRATDGQQALSILRRQHPDAVLLDLVMPEMDGFRLLEARQQDPALRSIPVIVTSARDPAGQPIVTGSLAVTRGEGLSVPQFLACIRALSAILSPTGLALDPALPGMPVE